MWVRRDLDSRPHERPVYYESSFATAPMPKTKQSRSTRPAATSGSHPTVCDKADVLFRSAAECCRQHRRYARLIAMNTDETEQIAALRLVAASDEQLTAAAAAYESSCMGVNGERRDDWWHKANNLWLACREYESSPLAQRSRVRRVPSPRRHQAHIAWGRIRARSVSPARAPARGRSLPQAPPRSRPRPDAHPAI